MWYLWYAMNFSSGLPGIGKLLKYGIETSHFGLWLLYVWGLTTGSVFLSHKGVVLTFHEYSSENIKQC